MDVEEWGQKWKFAYLSEVSGNEAAHRHNDDDQEDGEEFEYGQKWENS